MKSRVAMMYLLLGLGSVGAYTYVSMGGWEYGTPARRNAPIGVTGSPGGYRTFHFWHAGSGGFRGGK